MNVDAAAGIDTGSTVDAAIDAPACTTDGKIYIAEGGGTSLRISSIDGVLTAGSNVASVTCAAQATAIGVTRDGAMFAALQGGGISRITATACTAMTVTPALTGDIALVGVGSNLLALERTSGKLWRIDPASGAATMLSTIAGVDAKTSLVGGSAGVMVYVPASLGGHGALTPLDAQGHAGTAHTISGASTVQAQADWVGVVGDDSKLWMTASGYYGAGGGRRTMWIPVQNDAIDSAAYEYYAPTIAVTAQTCP